jgi:V/A-type H+-transporting ATPase subunit E
MSKTQKMNNFLRAINKYAEEQRHKIQDEAEKFKERELEKAEREALKDAYRIIQTEMTMVKSEIASKISKEKMKAKKEIAFVRKKILESVFFISRNKILDFTKTDEYKKWMFKIIGEILELEIFANKKVVFFVRKEDEKLLKDFKLDLMPNLKVECEVKVSKDIHLGGVKLLYKRGSILIDETLDTKIENQKDWFFENSNLWLKESL